MNSMSVQRKINLKHHKSVTLACGLALCFASGNIKASDIGPSISDELNELYRAQISVCTDSSDSKPGYFCSGVLIRAVGEFEDPWTYTPLEKLRGGASFSYIRSDIDVSPNTLYGYHGITLSSPSNALMLGKQYNVACMFPVNGESDQRDRLGCGDIKAKSIDTVSTCENYGVFIAEQWISLYERGNRVKCTFDGASTSGFSETIRAQNIYYSQYSNSWGLWNEFIIPTWDINKPEQLPINAFWYAAYDNDFDHLDSLEFLNEARRYQVKYLNRTGILLPILRLTDDTDSPFLYVESDQGLFPTEE